MSFPSGATSNYANFPLVTGSNYYLSDSITGGITNGPFYGGTGQDKVIKKFCVKLVLTSDSGKEYLYPKINDLRVIALQV